MERKHFYAVFPSVLLPLIRAGHIKKEDLSDIDRVIGIIKRRAKFATSNMKIGIALEYTFEEEARSAWGRGNKGVAIVLLAVALEQCLNGTLRIIIEARGFESDHVTGLLRLQNIEPKLTWLFEMYSGKRFPKPLFKRAKKIFEIRNMLVHYKAVPGHPDKEEDSFSKIEKEIKALGDFRLRMFFMRFHTFCWDIAEHCDPAISLALKFRKKIMHTTS